MRQWAAVFADEMARRQIRQLEENCADFGIRLYGLDDPNQGIVHIIGPELGLTNLYDDRLRDSHTATTGLLGRWHLGLAQRG